MNTTVRSPVSALLGLVVAVTCSPVSATEMLCPSNALSDESGGYWPIPEEEFTQLKARREIERLTGLLGHAALWTDAVIWETSFVYIEGWYLKRQALEARKEGNGEPFVSDFCSFLDEHAYVRH